MKSIEKIALNAICLKEKNINHHNYIDESFKKDSELYIKELSEMTLLERSLIALIYIKRLDLVDSKLNLMPSVSKVFTHFIYEASKWKALRKNIPIEFIYDEYTKMYLLTREL